MWCNPLSSHANWLSILSLRKAKSIRSHESVVRWLFGSLLFFQWFTLTQRSTILKIIKINSFLWIFMNCYYLFVFNFSVFSLFVQHLNGFEFVFFFQFCFIFFWERKSDDIKFLAISMYRDSFIVNIIIYECTYSVLPYCPYT